MITDSIWTRPKVPLIFGRDPSEVLAANGGEQFDVAICADVVFNHASHERLAESLKALVRPGGTVWVAWCSHRPWLARKDMAFCSKVAKEHGMTVERLPDVTVPPQFPDDDFGDRDNLKVRSLLRVRKLTVK